VAHESGGVKVRGLFTLLAFLGIPQIAVARHLGLKHPVVSQWAQGHRPMPRQYLEAFEAFVWEALGRKSIAYQDAVLEVIAGGWPGWDRGDAATEPLICKPPPPDAPPVVHQWWAFHVRTLELMDAWDTERHEDELRHEVGELCRAIGGVGLYDDDKLAAYIRGPERIELLAQFERGAQILRDLASLDEGPSLARLRQAIAPRRSRKEPT
jgi:hypothetical protein